MSASRKTRSLSEYQFKAKRHGVPFKKGHKLWKNRNLSVGNGASAKLTNNVNPFEWKRLPKSVFEAANTGNDCTLPSKLRPMPEIAEDNEFETISPSNFGNAIVKLDVIPKLFNDFYRVHTQQSEMCPLEMEIMNLETKGLCVELAVKCKHCNIHVKAKMYDEISQQSRRGPRKGSLNVGLAMAVLKTKVGMSDLKFLFSCLNIKTPASSRIQHLVNYVSDNIQVLNKQSMITNQEFCKKICQIRGEDCEVDVETDVSYNNRIQSGFEAGTQAFAPLVESITKNKLVLNCQVANKLCRKLDCTHDNCQKTVNNEESMSSYEKILLKRNVDEVNNTGIVSVKSITTDGCGQLTNVNFSKGTPRHFTCFIHKMRRLYVNIKNMRLHLPHLTADGKVKFFRKLALAIRYDMAIGLTRLKNRAKDENDFVWRACAMRDNLVSCFNGNHALCKKFSLTCGQNINKKLPFGQYLNLTNENNNVLTSVLQRILNVPTLFKLTKRFNTNKSESIHHRVFTYSTKQTTWCRNFPGFCHSAVHSDTYGTGKSTLILGQHLGINTKCNKILVKHMLLKDKKSKYDFIRQNQSYVIKKRHYSKLSRCNRILNISSMYTGGKYRGNFNSEHNYALNLNESP